MTKSVAGLAAGERVVVEIAAPRCEPGTERQAAPPTPAAQIAESNETNNIVERRCGGR